ncbi:MAG: hypothetical protein IJU60_02915 [Acholeplasmatales bacterium]|nr:hypothetical protein [Acholeplasmatales bacterium]
MENKYIIYFLLGVLIALAIAIVLTAIVKLIGKKKVGPIVMIIIGFVSFLASLSIAITIYLTNYNHKDQSADDYLKSSTLVSVNKIDDGYFFDGIGSKNAIIFYPGAKVEYTAYAPLLYNLALEGIDCFLIDMPCNLAFLGKSKANNILGKYNYENYYLMGHSLGGAMGASYLANNTDKFKGLILLASYSTVKLPDNFNVLSIYGTNDGVLKMDKYTENKTNLPANFKEVVIDGANHSGYANYVTQSDDHLATITVAEQQSKTRLAILSFIYGN